MKILKIGFSILILAILIVALAAGGLVVFINPNKLKPVFSEEIRKQTGYQAIVEGNITWTFIPQFGVKIDNIKILKPEENSLIASLEKTTVGMEITQLFYGIEKLNGKVHADVLKIRDIIITNLDTEIYWQKPNFLFRSIKGDFYEGTLKAHLSGQWHNEQTSWDLDAEFEQAALKPFLENLNYQGIKLSGKGDIKINGTTKGLNQPELLKNFIGKAEFSISQGALHGINMINFLERLGFKLNESETLPNYTSFESMIGTVDFKDGVAAIPVLTLRAKYFTAAGAGLIELVNNKVDLRMNLIPNLNGVSLQVPMKINGNFKALTIEVEGMEAQRLINSNEIDKIKNKARKLIHKHLSGEAANILEDLLGS